MELEQGKLYEQQILSIPIYVKRLIRLCFSLRVLIIIEMKLPHKKDEGKIKYVGNKCETPKNMNLLTFGKKLFYSSSVQAFFFAPSLLFCST